MSVHTDPAADTPTAAPTHRPAGWGRAFALPLLVAGFLAILVSAFAWPAIHSGPHGIEIAVAAPAPLAQGVQAQLAASAGNGAFTVMVVPDRAAATRQILDRNVYGALVLGPQGGEALIASAASPAVAQVLTEVASHIPPQAGGPLKVTDVMPLPTDDPRGLGLAAGLLPLVLGGLILGALTALRLPGRGARAISLGTGAVAGGLMVVGLLQGWLGALDGSYLANAATAALLIFSISATMAALHRLLGAPGIALTAVLMIVLGSPLSGVTSAPEMLPAGWATLGQLMPPGAGATSLRSVAFFGGAGAGIALIVLGAWVAVGLLLMMLPRGASRARLH